MLRRLAAGSAAALLALGTQPRRPERSSVGFLETVLHVTTDRAAALLEPDGERAGPAHPGVRGGPEAPNPPGSGAGRPYPGDSP